MILKSSYQQVVIVVDRDELADMLLGPNRVTTLFTSVGNEADRVGPT
jgi:hypothetical protein